MSVLTRTELEKLSVMYEGDKNRDATSKIRGFLFQDYVAIMSLLKNQVKYICLEYLEDVDVFFEDEHNRWLLLESRLKELGYSYDEVKALKEHYRSEGAKLKSLEQEASKELKLAESIRKDFVGADGQEVERQQEEVKEQNMEHEKQPRR